jgi:vacuolar protein sorting-associated protein VTA1
LKQELGHSDLLTNDTAAYAYLENFALKVFLIADNEDRADKASKRTAQTFYTAAILLDVLKVFGELEPEV